MDYEYSIFVNRIVPMLTVEDVSRLLHVHANTVRRWSDRGIIRAYRISERGDRRFRREDIAHFLSQFKVDVDEPEITDNARI